MKTMSRAAPKNLPSQAYIEAVTPRERQRALAFLLNDQGAETGDVGCIESLDRERLYWAHVGNELVGVTWAHWTSPTTITIVPPRVSAAASRATAQQLLAALLGSLSADLQGQACCAVVLLDDVDRNVVHSSRDLLQEAGFEPVSTVDFVMATGVRSDLATRIVLRSAGREQRDQFQQLLRETTRAEDSTESSAWVRWRRAAGLSLEADDVATMAGSECYFVQYHGRAIGALVLGRETASDAALEIRYLGVCPAERRRGFAIEALTAVRNLAAQEARLVIAAVDSGQRPAVRAYDRAGFHAWRRRTLWALRAEG